MRHTVHLCKEARPHTRATCVLPKRTDARDDAFDASARRTASALARRTPRCDTVWCPSWLEAGSTCQRRSGTRRSVVLRRTVGPVVGHRQRFLPYGRGPVRVGPPPGVSVRAARLGLASKARPRSVVRRIRLNHADRGVVRCLMAATQREGRSVSAGGRDRPPRRLGTELLHAVHEARRTWLRPRACSGANNT